MSEFNLLDEKWIPVIDNDCNNLNVSILELFKNASKYISIAGDTEVQTISITRFLLSILQTVFSRFDENGEEYGYFGLNDMFKQKTEIDPNVIEDYVNDLNEAWINLWEKKSFPKIVETYLNKYHDRFYLYDDEYPFYQVSSNIWEDFNVISRGKQNAKPSNIPFKKINGNFYESNSLRMFNVNDEKAKNKLSDSELARWIITYQNYSNTSDKAVFDGVAKKSYGWLYKITTMSLRGSNVFETLMLNLVLVHPVKEFVGNSQKPCWEESSNKIITKNIKGYVPDNLAELYNTYSRAIRISNNSLDVCKLSLIEPIKLESMAILRYKEKEDIYNTIKVRSNYSLWQVLLLISKGLYETPVILENLLKYSENIDFKDIKIDMVTLIDDGNALSYVPKEEIFSSFNVNVLELFNKDSDLYKTLEYCYTVVQNYSNFLYKITQLNRYDDKSSKGYIEKKLEPLYFYVDRELSANIDLEDFRKDFKMFALHQIKEFSTRKDCLEIYANLVKYIDFKRKEEEENEE